MSLPVKIATACFLKKTAKTLFIDYTLTNHIIHAGKFAPPGGKLYNGEPMDIGAAREVYEETNIIARSLVYRGKITFLNEKRTINERPMENNWEVHFYDCYDFDDSQAKAREGSLAWVRNADVLALPLHEGDRVLWKEWLTNYKEFEGIIIHEGEQLTGYALKSYVSLS